MKRNVLILLFLGLSCLSLYGQQDTKINMQDFDKRKVHYGYLMGLNYSTFKLKFSDEYLAQDTVSDIQPVGGPGFELGFIFNYRLGEFFDARALPKVSFYERTLKYYFSNYVESDEATFEASNLELPLLLKYKSSRRRNTRLYMVGGVKGSFEVGAKRRQNRNDQIGFRNFSFFAEYGVGLDIYNQLFKLSPELRFSLGLTDILQPADNIYSAPLAAVKPFSFSFSLMFE